MALGNSEAVKQQQKSGGSDHSGVSENGNSPKKIILTDSAPSSGGVEPLQSADVLRSVVRDS